MHACKIIILLVLLLSFKTTGNWISGILNQTEHACAQYYICILCVMYIVHVRIRFSTSVLYPASIVRLIIIEGWGVQGCVGHAL